jgi:hypothetical protein
MTTAINPETRVGALLDAYPDLEAVLISLAPPFEKLRNPILRRTVAKVATLEQAARIGGMPVRELVQALRRAAGQAVGDVVSEAPMAGESAMPQWVVEGSIREDIDGDAMLERGVHPVGRVKEGVDRLGGGEVLRLMTSFRPEPLIEMMRRRGNVVHSAEASPGRHVTYFGRKS